MKKEKSKEFIALCEKYGVDHNVVPEILSYEEACKITKRNPKVERDAMQKTMVVIDAFCKESQWTANYDKPSQYKHFPVFYKTKAGLVFSDTDCEDWFSHSDALVGAPFVLPTSDHARFMGQHFLGLYAGWMLKYKVK